MSVYNPIKLFLNAVSPTCRSVQMLVNILKVKTDIQNIEILSKNGCNLNKDINPILTVPVLKDQDLVLWESRSILPYLVCKHYNNHSLYPKDLKIRATIDQKLHFDTGILFPTLYNAIIPILHRNQIGISKVDVNCIRKCYSLVDSFLHHRDYLCTNKLTIADLACMSTISTLDLLHPIQKAHFPRLLRYIEHAEQQSFYEINNEGLDALSEEIESRLTMAESVSA